MSRFLKNAFSKVEGSLSTESRITPRRQIHFYEMLLKARKTVLSDKLKEALLDVDPKLIAKEIHTLVESDVLAILSAAGIRDEYVFPAPSLLKAAPTLVGYYRLLLGLPQKTFYHSKTGMGKFRAMEMQGKVTASDQEIVRWCQDMTTALSELIREIASTLEQRDISDMQIMTLGQQIQGGRNNTIGAAAAKAVFSSISDLVRPYIVASAEDRIKIKTSSGREFSVVVSSDPDIFVQESGAALEANRLALEIKGGEDGSNVHNRTPFRA